jgi:hypothetical protein
MYHIIFKLSNVGNLIPIIWKTHIFNEFNFQVSICKYGTIIELAFCAFFMILFLLIAILKKQIHAKINFDD